MKLESALEECSKATADGGRSLEVDVVSDGKPIPGTTSPDRNTIGDPFHLQNETVCSGSGFFTTKPPWLEEELRFKTDYYDKKRSKERERRRALRCPGRKIESEGNKPKSTPSYSSVLLYFKLYDAYLLNSFSFH